MGTTISYLDYDDPDPPKGELWILLEEDNLGKWYGTGFGMNAEGDEVMYISQANSDESYDSAIIAACVWAKRNGVDAIFVRRA